MFEALHTGKKMQNLLGAEDQQGLGSRRAFDQGN
jgi:hypothetical protein